MTPRKFLSVFTLIVALVVIVCIAAAYLEIEEYKMEDWPESLVRMIKKDKPSQGAASTTTEILSSRPNEEITSISLPLSASSTNDYFQEIYSYSRGETGRFKKYDTERNMITMEVGGKDYFILVTPSTEIFRNGRRGSLIDINQTDIMTVLGREKEKNSDTLVADSIYSNTVKLNAAE